MSFHLIVNFIILNYYFRFILKLKLIHYNYYIIYLYHFFMKFVLFVKVIKFNR